MGTKLNPGAFDCYYNALPDEPMFVLLARDPLAPFLASIWGHIRNGDPEGAKNAFAAMLDTAAWQYAKEPDLEKAREALNCATDMFGWRSMNPKPELGYASKAPPFNGDPVIEALVRCVMSWLAGEGSRDKEGSAFDAMCLLQTRFNITLNQAVIDGVQPLDRRVSAAEVLDYIDTFAGQENTAEEVRDFVQTAARMIEQGATYQTFIDAGQEHFVEWCNVQPSHPAGAARHEVTSLDADSQGYRRRTIDGHDITAMGD